MKRILLIPFLVILLPLSAEDEPSIVEINVDPEHYHGRELKARLVVTSFMNRVPRSSEISEIEGNSIYGGILISAWNFEIVDASAWLYFPNDAELITAFNQKIREAHDADRRLVLTCSFSFYTESTTLRLDRTYNLVLQNIESYDTVSEEEYNKMVGLR